MALFIDEIAFNTFSTRFFIDAQCRTVVKTDIASQDMGAGKTAELILAESGEGLQGLIHNNDLALQVQNNNPDGNFIQQFAKVDGDIEKIIDTRGNRDALIGKRPN